MIKDEALKLALEALNDLSAWNDGEVGGHMDEPYSAEVARRTITAIKEALAQTQEPVAWEQFYPDICKPQIEQPKVRTGDCLLVGVCASEGHKIQKAQPKQEPLAWISTSPARMIHWTSDKPAYGDDWVPLYTTPPQRTERPVDCERCNRLEEQAYDLVGKLRVANIKLSMLLPRTWVGLEKSDMPDGADPLFDDPKFIAGMVYAANKLKEKNNG